MLSGTHLTIRDYFDAVNIAGHGNRNRSSSGRLKTAGKTSFKQILSSRRAQKGLTLNAKKDGLTAADYMAHPVRAKRPHPSPPISTVSEIKEEKSAENPSENINSASKPNWNPFQFLDKTGVLSVSRQIYGRERQKIEQSIRKAAEKYDLPPGLIKGIIRAESNFNVKAVSRAGARGLMQLMPATAKELGVKNPFNIDQNIDGGSRYFRRMLDNFGDDIRLALAAYNAGPQAVKKYGYPVPFQETQHYVNRVIQYFLQEV